MEMIKWNRNVLSMTNVLEHLNWESPKKQIRYRRLILLYEGLKGNSSIPTDDQELQESSFLCVTSTDI